MAEERGKQVDRYGTWIGVGAVASGASRSVQKPPESSLLPALQQLKGSIEKMNRPLLRNVPKGKKVPWNAGIEHRALKTRAP